MSGYPRKPVHSRRRDTVRRLAEWKDSAAARHPDKRLRGETRRANIPKPDVNEAWHPEVQSWFRSFFRSGQVEFWEASDYATLVAAATAYDRAIRFEGIGWFNQFVRLSERLGATVADRTKARIVLDEPDPEKPTDEDEEAADAKVISWQDRLNARDSKPAE